MQLDPEPGVARCVNHIRPQAEHLEQHTLQCDCSKQAWQQPEANSHCLLWSYHPPVCGNKHVLLQCQACRVTDWHEWPLTRSGLSPPGALTHGSDISERGQTVSIPWSSCCPLHAQHISMCPAAEGYAARRGDGLLAPLYPTA